MAGFASEDPPCSHCSQCGQHHHTTLRPTHHSRVAEQEKKYMIYTFFDCLKCTLLRTFVQHFETRPAWSHNDRGTAAGGAWRNPFRSFTGAGCGARQ